MGKKSQRKGRSAELELAEILRAAGWSAIAKPIYASMDVDWEGRDCEVKRKANGMKQAYDAFRAGARAYFHRSDREQWLIVMPLAEYIRDHGPAATDFTKFIELAEPIE